VREKLRKLLFLLAKLTIAGLLLTWVLSRVHWRDYVVDKDTKDTYAVVSVREDEQGGKHFEIAQGMLWWQRRQMRPAEDFLTAQGLTRRPGFAGTLARVRWPLLSIACGGFLLSVLTISVRWRYLLRVQDIHISYWEAIRLTFLGYFSSLVVPGTVGGDVVKAYYIAKQTHLKGAALLSVFVDRVLGFTDFAILATVMTAAVLLTGLGTFEQMRLAALGVGVILVAVAGILVFLLSRRFRRFFHLERFYRKLPIAHHIQGAGDAAVLYRKRFGSLLKAIGMTFVAHMFFIGSITMVARSLEIDTPVYRFFVYVPIIYIAGALPLTPAGFGVLESLYVKFFAVGVIGASQVLPLALLARLIPLFWTLPGLLVFLTGTKPPPSSRMEAELDLDENRARPLEPAAPSERGGGVGPVPQQVVCGVAGRAGAV